MTILSSFFKSPFYLKIIFSLLAVFIYVAILFITHLALSKYGKKRRYLKQRIIYVKKIFKFFLFLIVLIFIALIWGIDFRGVLIIASSFFAIVGIALFASWSILSNITSSVILFFYFPYRIGDRIKIIDGDNSVEGKIIDMTLFTLRVEDKFGNTVSYPNNLVVQKPILKLKKEIEPKTKK